MPREVEPSLNEKQFFAKALQEKIRIDGRAFDQFRALELDFGEEHGVADVRLGKTRIQIRITTTITTPLPTHPFSGIFTLHSELSPMVSPAFDNTSRTESELLLSGLLEVTLRRSSALDVESLCLIAGQKCWSVRADIHVLSHDGNLVDAASIGVIAALQNHRKEDTEVRGEEVVVFGRREREMTGLILLHWPVCVTFSFYGGGKGEGEGEDTVCLLDATAMEESIREGCCTIGMNRHGEVCQIAKLGGVPVDAVTLLHCANVALVKVKEISAFIAKRLEEDTKKRDKGLTAELSAENAR